METGAWSLLGFKAPLEIHVTKAVPYQKVHNQAVEMDTQQTWVYVSSPCTTVHINLCRAAYYAVQALCIPHYCILAMYQVVLGPGYCAVCAWIGE